MKIIEEIEEHVEVFKPRGKAWWENLILGDFEDWIRRKIEPTLKKNKELQHDNKNTR